MLGPGSVVVRGAAGAPPATGAAAVKSGHTIFGKLILFKGTHNFLCKSNHVLVVNSDILCNFHPKIAYVKLAKTPPKAMEWV